MAAQREQEMHEAGLMPAPGPPGTEKVVEVKPRPERRVQTEKRRRRARCRRPSPASLSAGSSRRSPPIQARLYLRVEHLRPFEKHMELDRSDATLDEARHRMAAAGALTGLELVHTLMHAPAERPPSPPPTRSGAHGRAVRGHAVWEAISRASLRPGVDVQGEATETSRPPSAPETASSTSSPSRRQALAGTACGAGSRPGTPRPRMQTRVVSGTK